MKRMISGLMLVLAAASALLLLAPAAPVSARQDVALAQRNPPICDFQSASKYIYYNVTDGKWHCTSTAPVVYNGSSLTATAGEINTLHSVTAGTVRASSAVVVDANKDISAFRHLTISGNFVTGSTTLSAAELTVLDAVTAGTAKASAAVVLDANKALDTVRVTTDRTLGGTAVPGAAVVQDELTKTVTAIADATATDLLTVTVPNAKHFAQIEVCLSGTLGAGGAIGAGEAGATNCYIVTVVRTAGVATVATASTAFGAAASAVAGAATATATVTLSAMTGAVSVTQTFTIKGTITKSGGSSANHVAFVSVRLLNGFATGITIA